MHVMRSECAPVAGARATECACACLYVRVFSPTLCAPASSFLRRRINEDSKTLSIQYFKKPGDFQASGTFSCGVESAVEVLEPPHVGEKGWPEQRVVRLKLGSDEMHANKDEYALLSTCISEADSDDIAMWAKVIQDTLETWWADGGGAVPSQPLADDAADDASGTSGAASEARSAVDFVFATNDFLGSGWLWKEGGRWRNWKRRWFELTTITFTYYDAPEGKLLGDIPLRSGTVIEFEHEMTKKGMRYSFRLLTPGRMYHVYTLDKTEFDKWEAAFQTMGCVVQQHEKVPQRGRSQSRIRMSGMRSQSLLAPEPGPLSTKFSRSASDLPSETRSSSASVASGVPTFRAKSSQSSRMKRLASAPTTRPANVFGESHFKTFEEFHRFLCPLGWQPSRGGKSDGVCDKDAGSESAFVTSM
eukprot:m.68925 g.68925  ORF g.68925 m.68925 type:complete len:418 (-) comp8550_c0_seq2:40-1293(-)